ncbi:hypothetical protein AeRB84_016839 [Aphanomyces euteiches]|nr:hypothetical protein AeRB84_016839 [Aphanomyces euteiches]
MQRTLIVQFDSNSASANMHFAHVISSALLSLSVLVHGALPMPGVCYSPFHLDEYPQTGNSSPEKLPSGIDADFNQMAQLGYTTVRTFYSSYYGVKVAPIAAKHNIQLYLGVFMTSESCQVNPATVNAILVGNENVVPNGPYTTDYIISQMKQIRDRVKSETGVSVPVGTVQRTNEWLNADPGMAALAKASDVIGVNIYPFFDGSFSFNNPREILDGVWGAMKNKYGESKLLVTETGWPTAGTPTSGAPKNIPSYANSQLYYTTFQSWMQSLGRQGDFWYTMYDSRPDEANPADIEYDFGLLTHDRKPKNGATFPPSTSPTTTPSVKPPTTKVPITNVPTTKTAPTISPLTTSRPTAAPTPHPIPKTNPATTQAPTTTKASPTPTPSSATCGSIQENTDFSGAVIGSTQQSSAEKCCGDCKANSQCRAFVWYEGFCYLKNSVGTVSSSSGRRAGIVQASATNTTKSNVCGALEININYIGQDIIWVSGSSPSYCCTACQANANCNAYTFALSTCYLKAARRSTASQPGAVSAQVNKCSSIEYGVDYPGNDITAASASSVDDCCAFCRSQNGCQAYTFWSGTCYLKSSRGTPVSNRAVSSGIVFV